MLEAAEAPSNALASGKKAVSASFASGMAVRHSFSAHHDVEDLDAQDRWLRLDDQSVHVRAATLTSLGRRHLRIDSAQGVWGGQVEVYGISPGFIASISDIELHQPYMSRGIQPNALQIRIASDMGAAGAADHGSLFEMNGGGGLIWLTPASSQPLTYRHEGCARAIDLYIQRDELAQIYADEAVGLPPMIQDFLAGNLSAPVAQRFALNPSLLRCLDDLQGSTLQHHGRRIHIQAEALKILCHAFEALLPGNDAGVDVSSNTMRGVLKAKQLLDDNFAAPPTINEIAQQVNLGRTCLCDGFRMLVGQSMFEYVAELRLQRALQLISQSNTSMIQIAYDVGYEHPSSFTKAIQRRFGATPTELRRGRLPAM